MVDDENVYAYEITCTGRVGVLQGLRSLHPSGNNYDDDASVRWTPLRETSDKGHLELPQLLIESGADVNARRLMGRTPLFSASEEGHEDVAQLLLERSAETNAWYDHKTALYQALEEGHLEITQLLFKHDADVNAWNVDSQTLLDVASQ